jgi:hypothetical protein
MLREVAFVAAAMVAIQVMSAPAHAADAPEMKPDVTAPTRVESNPPALKRHVARTQVAKHDAVAHEATSHEAVAHEAVAHEATSREAAAPVPPSHVSRPHIVLAHRIRRPVVTPPTEPEPKTEPALTDQEEVVSQLAEMKGDRDYLMVDKTRGKIILFENNEPVFAGPALTGESTADALPPGELKEKFDNLNSLETKVTPAGRYTVSRGRDDDYGPVLDINEIRGSDWGIAIHKVWLGTPSEHREQRIQSPNEQDKHITFGCINVTPDAIRFLLKKLPEKGATPLYILPEDDTRTVAYFAARGS